jgi:hypothetical protein
MSNDEPTSKWAPMWSETQSDTDASARWRTPPEMFGPLHAEFQFGLDAAAMAESALVPYWLGPDHPNPSRRDAFTADWGACRYNPEKWKSIEGWPGYAVSQFGRVRGPGRNDDGSMLVGSLDKDGYRRVTLVRGSGATREQRSQRVSSAVADAFLGSRTDGLVLRHLDNDPSNDRASNLAYGTVQRNIDDRDAAGRTARGEAHGMAKLTAAQVDEIRTLEGTPAAEVAERFGVKRASIYAIWSGRTWGPPSEKEPDLRSPYQEPAIFVNPPYGRGMGRWIVLAARWGRVVPVVVLILARTDLPWWDEVVMRTAAEIRFVRRRVRFLREDGSRAHGAPAPSVVLVWRPGSRNAGSPKVSVQHQKR